MMPLQTPATYQNEPTNILEINFRRLLLACEAKHRQVSSTTTTTSTTPTKRQRPHSHPVLRNQTEALEAMLSELQARLRERVSLTQHHTEQHPNTEQEQHTLSAEIENTKQLGQRTDRIVTQWKRYTADANVGSTHTPAITTTTTTTTTTNSKAVQSSSPILVKFCNTIPSSNRTGQSLQRLPILSPTTAPTTALTTGPTQSNSYKRKKTVASKKNTNATKKNTFHKELRSWQKTLGLLDATSSNTAPSTLTDAEERQRLEDQTEQSLEDILETTTSLKGVVQASKIKIQDDLERIDQTFKMVDTNQHAVDKNTAKAKEQSKALWGDLFTELKMAVAAVLMTLVIVIITRVPFLSLFFRKQF